MRVSYKALLRLIKEEINKTLAEQDQSLGAPQPAPGHYTPPTPLKVARDVLWWRKTYGDKDKWLEHYQRGPCSDARNPIERVSDGDCANPEWFPTEDEHGNPPECGKHCDLFEKIDAKCAALIEIGLEKSKTNLTNLLSNQLTREDVIKILCDAAREGGGGSRECVICEEPLVAGFVGPIIKEPAA